MTPEEIRSIVQETIRAELAAFFAASTPAPSKFDDLLAVIATQGPQAGVAFARTQVREKRKVRNASAS